MLRLSTMCTSAQFGILSGLADLNEPDELEVAIIPSSVGFLGYGNSHKETISLNVSAKLNPAFLALPRETTWNSIIQCLVAL
uniref:Uncharacterized protein n=1 Tax=Solanum lycopersicum TaxID=4081 RepID=A0A3Q7H0Q8_SOLLC